MRIVMVAASCVALMVAGCSKSGDAQTAPAKSAEPPTAGAAPAPTTPPTSVAAPSTQSSPLAAAATTAAATTATAKASQPGGVECGGAAGKAGCAAEGCGGGSEGNVAVATSSAVAAKVGHYGAAFTLDQAVPVSDVLSKVEKTSDTLVKVSGTIAAVCQKKGCWLVVTDGKMKARIKMKNYGFTVPIDSKGKQTVVEGTVTVKVWNEAQAKHLEEDAGRDPSKVTGTRKEYLLTATAIDIKG